MRKKLSVVAAGMLAAATLSIGSPARADFHGCVSTDPVLAYVCQTIGGIDPAWVNHYYNVVIDTAHWAYCSVSPRC